MKRGVPVRKMTREEHRRRHIELHKALDELLADFISHRHGSCLDSSVGELAAWSCKQTKNPTDSGCEDD